MTDIVNRLFLYTICVFLWGGVNAAQAAKEPITLIFGVAPQQSPSEVAHLWNPLFSYLTQKTGYRFQFRTAREVAVYDQRLDKGEFDISYMSPYHYTVVHKHVGYEVFAKEKDRKLKGIIITRKDSTYKTIEDLQGAQIAFPGPLAIAATILPLAQLKKDGIKVKPVYVASHDSVFKTVIKGLYPAGGTIERLYESLEPEQRDQLRILWQSSTYTPHAIAAHPRVPTEVVEKIKTALLAMEQDPVGRQVLTHLTFKGIVSATDAEYADMRALGDIVKEITKQ